MPQISDPDYRTRPVFREADLRRHLTNERGIENRAVEEDAVTDPRFSQTAEQLREQGIEDFQLHYAAQTLARLARNPQLVAELSGRRAAAATRVPVRSNR